MLIHTDIVQGSSEWLNLRLGKITGSCFHKLLSSTVRKKYPYEKANEIVTGSLSDSETLTLVHMQRGQIFEEEARNQYTIKTFMPVTEIGFVQYNDYVGCSPDGLVYDEGMIEIKVPDSGSYFQHRSELKSMGIKAIKKEHYAQMQFNMFVCKRKWCDYVLFNKQHEVNNKSLFIFRVECDEEMQLRIGEIIEETTVKIKSYVEEYYTIE